MLHVMPAALSATAVEYLIAQSLRFNDDDSAYLYRTPASAGNRKTWTISAWVKRGSLGTTQRIFNANDGTPSGESDFAYVGFLSTDKLAVGNWSGAWLTTTAAFKDTSGWYHIVVQFDSTNATSGDRCRLYVNGTEITAFDTDTAPTLNVDTAVNNTVPQVWGRRNDSASQYFDGLMALPILVDGSALDYTSFAETNGAGDYVPIEYVAETLAADQTATFEASYIDNTTTSAYTFSSCDLGAGTSAKRVIVGTSGAGTVGTETISSVTIDGVTATEVVTQDSSGGGRPTGLFYADTNSTTGDVVVTFSTNCSEAGIGIWSTTTSAVPFDTNSNTADNTALTLNTPAGGFAVGYRMSATGGGTFTWTGLTEDFDDVQRASFAFQTGAHKNYTAYTSESISVNASTGSQHSLVVASFQPTGLNLNGGTYDFSDTSNYGLPVGSTAPTETASTSGAWTGDTGTVTFTGDDVNKTSGATAIYAPSTAITGDFDITFTINGTTTSARVGVFDVAEIGTWNQSDPEGGMKSMTNSCILDWGNGQYYNGSTGEGGSMPASGSVVTIRRRGSTITVIDDGSTVNTFGVSFSGDVHVVVGNTSNLLDMSWTPAIPDGYYESSGFATTDQLNDVPTDDVDNDKGNFATLSPSTLQSDATLANGNLNITASDVTVSGNAAEATIGGLSTGKWFWYSTCPSFAADSGCGIYDNSNAFSNVAANTGSNGQYAAGIDTTSNMRHWALGSTPGDISLGFTADVSNDLLIYALDADNDAFWVGVYDDSAGTLHWIDDPGASAGMTGDPTDGGTTASFNLTGSNWVPFAWTTSSSPAGIDVFFDTSGFPGTIPSGYKAIATHNLSQSAPSSPLTSPSFTGNASADGPLVWLGYTPNTAGTSTINGNTITWGTHAIPLAGGFKVITSSTSYNSTGTNTISIAVAADSNFEGAGDPGQARAQYQ